jgi:GTPase involved in cell partitioning and DNA repair
MGLSNAERQRLYRQKRDQDPARRAAYLQQKRDQYENDVTTGKRKLVAQLTAKERKKQQKMWKKQKRESRRKMKEAEAFTNKNFNQYFVRITTFAFLVLDQIPFLKLH